MIHLTKSKWPVTPPSSTQPVLLHRDGQASHAVTVRRPHRGGGRFRPAAQVAQLAHEAARRQGGHQTASGEDLPMFFWGVLKRQLIKCVHIFFLDTVFQKNMCWNICWIMVKIIDPWLFPMIRNMFFLGKQHIWLATPSTPKVVSWQTVLSPSHLTLALCNEVQHSLVILHHLTFFRQPQPGPAASCWQFPAPASLQGSRLAIRQSRPNLRTSVSFCRPIWRFPKTWVFEEPLAQGDGVFEELEQLVFFLA